MIKKLDFRKTAEEISQEITTKLESVKKIKIEALNEIRTISEKAMKKANDKYLFDTYPFNDIWGIDRWYKEKYAEELKNRLNFYVLLDADDDRNIRYYIGDDAFNSTLFEFWRCYEFLFDRITTKENYIKIKDVRSNIFIEELFKFISLHLTDETNKGLFNEAAALEIQNQMLKEHTRKFENDSLKITFYQNGNIEVKTKKTKGDGENGK